MKNLINLNDQWIRVIICCFFSLLTLTSKAEGNQNPEPLLPAEVHEMATELLELVKEEFAAGKARTVSAEEYAKHPYWVAVFRLGKAVTPDLRKKLQAASEMSEVENLALGAALCTFDRERLERLIARYRNEFRPAHRGKGMYRVKLLPEHSTPENRVFWEMLLLSPRIDQLTLGRCGTALGLCGTVETFQIFRLARERILFGDDGLTEWMDSISSLMPYAGSGKGWIYFVSKIDSGGETGLREILYLAEMIENDYPQISFLKRFQESPFYHPDMKGTTEYVLEDIFPEKNENGGWVWREAMEKIDTSTLTPRGVEVVEMMRNHYRSAGD